MNTIVQNYEPPLSDHEAIRIIRIVSIIGCILLFYYGVIIIPETSFLEFAISEILIGITAILLIRAIKSKSKNE